jgi:hypothetical protein
MSDINDTEWLFWLEVIVMTGIIIAVIAAVALNRSNKELERKLARQRYLDKRSSR